MDAVANIQEARKYFAAASETNQPYDVVIGSDSRGVCCELPEGMPGFCQAHLAQNALGMSCLHA